MLGARPRREVGPAFADQLERQIGPEPVDLRQVDAEDRVQGRAASKAGALAVLRAGGGARAACRPAAAALGLQTLQHRLDPRVAVGHLLLVDVVEVQGLRQGEDVLLALVAGQGLPDRLGRGMAAPVAMGGQHGRVALAGHDGADDAQAGRPGDVRDDVVELQVHLRQRLLHVLDVRRRRSPAAARAGAGRRAAPRSRPSGRKLARSRPYSCRRCSHWASLTSVLRPGTCLASRALTSTTSKPRCSRTS